MPWNYNILGDNKGSAMWPGTSEHETVARHKTCAEIKMAAKPTPCGSLVLPLLVKPCCDAVIPMRTCVICFVTKSTSFE